MTTYNTPAQVATPQTIADVLVDQIGAPATLVAAADANHIAVAASGVDTLGGSAAKANQTFEVGSQTKMMTAVVIFQLAEEGLLDLNAPIADYLQPKQIEGVANAGIATVWQALKMQAGIPNYTDIERPDGSTLIERLADRPNRLFDFDDAVAFLDGLPADLAAGERYAYSNADYLYLGEVIEAVTGDSLGEVFTQRIFSPLRMSSSYLEDFRADPKRLSSYLPDDDELIDVTNVRWDAGAEGGVISTTEDMIRFMKALLVDQSLVSDEALEQMMTFDGVDPQGFSFGAGLVKIDDPATGTFVGFAGGTLGTETATYLHLETGRIVSAAVTQTGLDAGGSAAAISLASLLADDAAWLAPNGPLTIDGVSAANIKLAEEDGEAMLIAGDATYLFDAAIADLGPDVFQFRDGSTLQIGHAGSDKLVATGKAIAADNQFLGFAGDDVIRAGNGDDIAVGGLGHDRLFGKAGDDRLKGGGGDDLLKGQTGSDHLAGAAGDDRLLGGLGLDTLLGGGGEDILVGQAHHDLLKGGGGDDVLKGGRGNDVLVGGNGSDVLIGGVGRDAFVFSRARDNGVSDADVVEDFQLGFDRIQVRARDITEISAIADGVRITLLGDDGDVIDVLGLGQFEPAQSDLLFS